MVEMDHIEDYPDDFRSGLTHTVTCTFDEWKEVTEHWGEFARTEVLAARGASPDARYENARIIFNELTNISTEDDPEPFGESTLYRWKLNFRAKIWNLPDETLDLAISTF